MDSEDEAVEITTGKVVRWDGRSGCVRMRDGTIVEFSAKHVMSDVHPFRRGDVVQFRCRVEYQPVYRMEKVLASYPEG